MSREPPLLFSLQVLIVDRTVDLLGPLLHELTYQAMGHDNLDIDANGVVSWDTSAGQQKQAILNEADELWVNYRHQHIAEIMQNIGQDMKEWQKGSAVAKSKAKGGKQSTSDMIKVVKELPAYQRQVCRPAARASAAARVGSALPMARKPHRRPSTPCTSTWLTSSARR